MNEDKRKLLSEIECDVKLLWELCEAKLTNGIRDAFDEAFRKWDEHFKKQSTIPGNRRDLLVMIPRMALHPTEHKQLIFQYMEPVLKEVQSYVQGYIEKYTQEALSSLELDRQMKRIEAKCAELLGEEKAREIFMPDMTIYYLAYVPGPLDPYSIFNLLRADLGIRKWMLNPTTYGISLYLKAELQKQLIHKSIWASCEGQFSHQKEDLLEKIHDCFMKAGEV